MVNCAIPEIGLAVAEEGQIVNWSQGQLFNPRLFLFACQSIQGQNTEPQTPPNLHASA